MKNLFSKAQRSFQVDIRGVATRLERVLPSVKFTGRYDEHCQPVPKKRIVYKPQQYGEAREAFKKERREMEKRHGRLAAGDHDVLWFLLCCFGLDLEELDARMITFARAELFVKDLATYSLPELESLVGAMGVHTQRHARKPDYLKALQKYRVERDTLSRLLSTPKEAPPSVIFRVCPELERERLRKYYGRLNETALAEEATRRCLNTSLPRRRTLGIRRNVSLKTALQRILHQSDQAYSAACEYMPMCLAEASTQQLRRCAAAVGVKQGDRTQQELLDAMTQFMNSLKATRIRMEHQAQRRDADADSIDAITQPVQREAKRSMKMSVAVSRTPLHQARRVRSKRKRSQGKRACLQEPMSAGAVDERRFCRRSGAPVKQARIKRRRLCEAAS